MTSLPSSLIRAAFSPEYVDFDTCRALFNLSRSTLYSLVSAGKIRSMSVPLRSQNRGYQLFLVTSVHAQLQSLTQAN